MIYEKLEQGDQDNSNIDFTEAQQDDLEAYYKVNKHPRNEEKRALPQRLELPLDEMGVYGYFKSSFEPLFTVC